MRPEVYVKFAEALNTRRMSQEKVAEAYAAGFCKAAEAMGVDPTELYKQAGLGQVLGSGWKALRGIAGRAGAAAKQRTMSVLKRYLELLGGGNLDTVAGLGEDLARRVALDSTEGFARFKNNLARLKGVMTGDIGGTAARNELLKVLGTGVATGGAAGYGVGKGLNALAGSGKQQA